MLKMLQLLKVGITKFSHNDDESDDDEMANSSFSLLWRHWRHSLRSQLAVFCHCHKISAAYNLKARFVAAAAAAARNILRHCQVDRASMAKLSLALRNNYKKC
jgi:hypothetical protein